MTQRGDGTRPLMRVLTEIDSTGQPTGKTSYWLWCPACDDAVRIDSTWTWNGDLERPTFTPSILTTSSTEVLASATSTERRERVCHSFLTDGVWQYLGDCTHDKAGQQVPMVALPDWLALGDS